MERIIYFQAGPVATTEELAEIAAINALAKPYEVLVMNGSASTAHGAGNVTADYVAGTIPTAYSEITEFDYNLVSVIDGAVLDTDDGGTVTFTVVDNTITSIVYAAGT